MGQCKPHCAIATHAEACHIGILRLIGYPEILPDELRQFLAYVIPVFFSIDLIAIEAVIDGRHHDDHILILYVALDRGTAHPYAVIITVAVQKVKHPWQLAIRHHFLCAFPMHIRQDHVHGH